MAVVDSDEEEDEHAKFGEKAWWDYLEEGRFDVVITTYAYVQHTSLYLLPSPDSSPRPTTRLTCFVSFRFLPFVLFQCPLQRARSCQTRRGSTPTSDGGVLGSSEVEESVGHVRVGESRDGRGSVARERSNCVSSPFLVRVGSRPAPSFVVLTVPSGCRSRFNSEMVALLPRRSSFAVSGTPAKNSVKDLQQSLK